MSLDVPVRIVTSMKNLQSHTISRPSSTRTIPATIRTAELPRMPLVLRQIQVKYLTLIFRQAQILPLLKNGSYIFSRKLFINLVFFAKSRGQCVYSEFALS